MNFKNLSLISLLLFIFVGSAIAQGQNTLWPPLESSMGLSGQKDTIGIKVVTRVDFILGNPEAPDKPYRYSYVLTNNGEVDVFVNWETLDVLFSGPSGGSLFFKLEKGESRDFFFYADQKPVKTSGSLKSFVQDGKMGHSIFERSYSVRVIEGTGLFLPEVKTDKSNKNLLVYAGGGVPTAYFPRNLWFKIKEIRGKHENTR